VHLQFTAEQWVSLEPKAGPTGRFGGPGRPGGPPGFGPGRLVAPAFLKGDTSQDGKLSSDEFQALGEKWFADWDRDKHGKLNADQLRAGLESLVASPKIGPGHPGRPGPGPLLQSPEGNRNGLAGAMGLDFKYVHADLDFNGQSLKNVAVRYKGNNTFME